MDTPDEPIVDTGTALTELDRIEARILGSLIEKQATTPDAYPLSLNALRLACNQSTNRDPVVEYDEATIRAALDRLGRRGWTRVASGGSSGDPLTRQIDSSLMKIQYPNGPPAAAGAT